MRKGKGQRRLRWLWAAAVVLLAGLTGCADTEPEQGGSTLWVVMEFTTSDSFNYQVEEAAAAFEEAHPGITIQTDILPTEESAREVYLKQLRTEIMAGKGPDVYILPTGNTLTVDAPTKYSQMRFTTQVEVELLFQDVTQAMYSGVFADVSAFYDADTALNTSALHPDIMDAGVVGDCRYVLPLRYTMPVLLTEPSNYSETGLSQELIDSGIDALAEYAMAMDDTMMAIGLRMPADDTLLPQLFDYQKGRMRITQQEIADYMRAYQRWRAMTAAPARQLVDEHLEELRTALNAATNYAVADVLREAMVSITLDSFNNVYDYGRYGYHWSLEGFGLYTDTMPGVLYQAAISKVLGKELQAQPLRRTDGSIVADVTYYGAVGSGCVTPEQAYDFLRIFLTEAYQWDLVRPRAERENIDAFDLPREPQVDGLIENSWPVRTKGSTQYLWDTLQYQNFQESYVYENLHKPLKSRDLVITDADLPILGTPIDEVRFPLCLPYEESMAFALTKLNYEDGTPTDMDIDSLAEQIYRYLWWHLAEG